MEQASTERRYETAARVRDQIGLLERARVPQLVVSRGGRATDVIGLARHGRRAAVAVLVLRGGRVVGKETRILDRVDQESEPELLQTFLAQHYSSRIELPRRLVLASEPADAEVLVEALSARAGHPLELLVPQRGRGRKLVESAARNAALALEDWAARRDGRRARFSPEVIDAQRVLGLPEPPYRIVCFDISNLGAEGAVAAIVASENGQPRKGLYRRMRMRNPGPDDFAMIAEAVERYWTRVESGELPRPDLVVVDGGAGQLSAARAALDRVTTRPIPMIGLAKREETVVREHAGPLTLPRRSPALRMLQRVRDEAHRFGLDYHRKLRTRARIASELDAIAGVGPARRAALLKAFGSVTALRQATLDQVAERAGLSRALAERVVAALAAEGAGEAAAPGDTPSGHDDPGTRRSA
jgi:excinuclease ABC subunit C